MTENKLPGISEEIQILMNLIRHLDNKIIELIQSGAMHYGVLDRRLKKLEEMQGIDSGDELESK